MSLFALPSKAMLPPSKSQGKDQKLVEADALMIEANSEKNKGNFQKALELYNTCLRLPGEKSVIHYELAQLYYQNFGDYGQALRHINKAIELNPNNNWYIEFYIKINHDNRYPQLVEKGYKMLLSNSPKNYDVMMEFAEFYILANQYVKALEMYDVLEKETGVSENVNKNKFLIYKGLGQPTQAIAELEKLLVKYPNNPEYYIELINMYKSLLDNAKVENSFKRALKALPNDPYIWDEYAYHLFNHKQIDSAYHYHQKIIKHPEYEIHAKMEIIDQYIKYERVDSSMKSKRTQLITLLEKTHPDNNELYKYLGEVYYGLKDFKKAKEYFIKTLSLRKNSFEIWQQLILADYEMADYIDMKKHCEQALEVFPLQSELYYYSAMSSIEQKNYEQGVEVLKQGLELATAKSLKIQYYSTLGDAYHSLNNHELSDKNYQKALELDSNNAFVLNNYAYYLSIRKVNLEKALYLSHKSIELNPSAYSFLDTYGWILYQMGKFDEALEWMLKAEAFGGDKSTEVLEHIGDTYKNLNKKEEAKTYWRRAMEVGGNKVELNKKINELK